MEIETYCVVCTRKGNIALSCLHFLCGECLPDVEKEWKCPWGCEDSEILKENFSQTPEEKQNISLEINRQISLLESDRSHILEYQTSAINKSLELTTKVNEKIQDQIDKLLRYQKFFLNDLEQKLNTLNKQSEHSIVSIDLKIQFLKEKKLLVSHISQTRQRDPAQLIECKKQELDILSKKIHVPIVLDTPNIDYCASVRFKWEPHVFAIYGFYDGEGSYNFTILTEKGDELKACKYNSFLGHENGQMMIYNVSKKDLPMKIYVFQNAELVQTLGCDNSDPCPRHNLLIEKALGDNLIILKNGWQLYRIDPVTYEFDAVGTIFNDPKCDIIKSLGILYYTPSGFRDQRGRKIEAPLESIKNLATARFDKFIYTYDGKVLSTLELNKNSLELVDQISIELSKDFVVYQEDIVFYKDNCLFKCKKENNSSPTLLCENVQLMENSLMYNSTLKSFYYMSKEAPFDFKSFRSEEI